MYVIPIASLMIWMVAGAAVRELLRAPSFFTDYGACPYEYCVYGKWVTLQKTPVFQAPSLKSRQIALLPKTMPIQALTGHVITYGKIFTVTKAHQPYQPNDQLVVYTYYGEGSYLVWFKGKMYTESLMVSPYTDDATKRCLGKDPHCWGQFSSPPSLDWWVKIQWGNGRTGWVPGHNGYRYKNQDGGRF